MALEERIAQEIAEWENLSSKHKRQMTWKKTTKMDRDIRNLIIAGGYISQFFPVLLDFHPQPTEAENDVEYAPLICFLTLLADDQDYVNGLMKKVSEAFN